MKSKIFWKAVCIVIFIAGVIGSIYLISKPHSQTVEIIQDGKLLYQIDLLHTDDKNIEVEYNGRKNSIRIEDHAIYMEYAECPDKTCIHMGTLKSSASPIICLPNKLVIQFAKEDDIDAEVK